MSYIATCVFVAWLYDFISWQDGLGDRLGWRSIIASQVRCLQISAASALEN